MVELFVEVCRRKGLKVSAYKSRVMVVGWEEGSVCDFLVDESQLEHVLEFKYWRGILDKLGTDGAEYLRKVSRRRKLAGVIRSLVNTRGLQLRAVQLDNIRGLLELKEG